MQDNNSSRELMQACTQMLVEKKAEDLLILDLTEIESAPANYFVLCSGSSEVHVRTLGDTVKRNTKGLVERAPRLEGFENAQWILIDFFDVVIHIMQPETRAFYKLERLWGDARTLEPNAEGLVQG